METWYTNKEEYEVEGYKCPYCGCEIIDYTDREIERVMYECCGNCYEEFRIEVVDC